VAAGTEAPRSEAIADRLRDEILDAILRGDWEPGERLPAERELAQRLSVNRSSVREALRSLEQLGLVVVRRGGGATVRSPRDAHLPILRSLLHAGGRLDAALALQILDVHEMLVCGAARLSAERGSDDQLLHARELLSRLGAPGLSREEVGRVLDALFDLVTESSGNVVLRLVRNAIGPIVAGELRPLFWDALRAPDDELRDQLQRIRRALEARDPVATEETVRALLRQRRQHVLAALERGEDPV
jgi:GntR family transcriptional regulator, transcriptional repressor for pyruvate dehydrogenase complex